MSVLAKSTEIAKEAAPGAVQGGAVGGPIGAGVGAATGAASATGLCDSCCGDGEESAAQQQAINASHPMSGNPEIDKQIQANRDAEYQEWEQAKDLAKFQKLPPQVQAQVGAFKLMLDELERTIPKEDMNLPIRDIMKKYPAQSELAYKKVQEMFPALKSVPMEYATALANSSATGDMTLADMKRRVDYVIANSSSPAAQAAKSSKGLAIAGVGAAALLLLGVFLRKK